MMQPQTERRPGVFRLWTLALALLCGTAAAVDDDVGGEPDPGEAAQRQQNLIDLGANFDANLFEQQHGNGWVLRGGPVPEAGARRASPAMERGREVGRKRIERIASACTMTEEQRQRLTLAVESDARRFAAEVDLVRSRYMGRQVNLNEPAGQKKWQAFQQDVGKCRERLRGLLDDGSLFATVVASVLDERQLGCLAAENAARRSFHWRAMVLDSMAKIDETLGLDQRQFDGLATALMAREPALRIDEQTFVRSDSNMRRLLVLMVLAEADAKLIKAQVSERQWKALSVQMNQARAMRSAIEQQGLLEKRR